MKTFPVFLNDTDDIVNFVKIVNEFDYDVDLKSGSVIIDAKSLMGAIAMSGSKTLELVIHSNECDGLVSELANYLCA